MDFKLPIKITFETTMGSFYKVVNIENNMIEFMEQKGLEFESKNNYTINDKWYCDYNFKF